MPGEQEQRYDDWGYPIGPRVERRPAKFDDDLLGVLRSIWLPLRRYRTIILLALTAIGLLAWLTGGEKAQREKKVDWGKFAYVQYATDRHNLCNSYMIFETLHRLKSKPARVLLYPKEWDLIDDGPNDRNSQLLLRASRLYKVKLKPISLLTDTASTVSPSDAASGWDTSITKLRAFELDEYDRVLHLDSDITLLQHLDDLFHLPPAPIAMPRAYWSDAPPREWPLTSLLMLIQPSVAEFKNLLDILHSWRLSPTWSSEPRRYDMDLLNHRFASSALVLPHRPYALLTAEFRSEDHRAYLGTINGPRDVPLSRWDPDTALAEAKLVHFSDWPLPKPWVMWPLEGLAEMQPDCGGAKEGTCRERVIWKGLYDDFRKRRKETCRILSVPAPKWSDLKNLSTSVPGLREGMVGGKAML